MGEIINVTVVRDPLGIIRMRSRTRRALRVPTINRCRDFIRVTIFRVSIFPENGPADIRTTSESGRWRATSISGRAATISYVTRTVLAIGPNVREAESNARPNTSCETILNPICLIHDTSPVSLYYYDFSTKTY